MMTLTSAIPAFIKLEMLDRHDDRIAFVLQLHLISAKRSALSADIITDFYENPCVQMIGADDFGLPADHTVLLLREMYKHMVGYLLYNGVEVGRSGQWTDPDLRSWIIHSFEASEVQEILSRLTTRVDPTAEPCFVRPEISVTIG